MKEKDYINAGDLKLIEIAIQTLSSGLFLDEEHKSFMRQAITSLYVIQDQIRGRIVIDVDKDAD